MSIYVGDKKAVLYRGDYHPAQFYKGDVKLAGYNVVEKQGTEIEYNDTYNDNLDFAVYGESEQTGIASPDYPSPIRSSENFDVVSCGKNLANIQDTTIIVQDFYFKDSAINFTLYPNTNYTFSFDYVVNATSGFLYAGIGFGVAYYAQDFGGNAPYPNQTAGRTVATFNSGNIGFDKKLFVRFVRAATPVTANVDISNVQLEFGTTTTPYQPYRATTAHITDPLCAIKVAPTSTDYTYIDSVGDKWIADSYEVVGEKVWENRRIAEKTLTGVQGEAWSQYRDSVGGKYATMFGNNLTGKSVGEIYCTHDKQLMKPNEGNENILLGSRLGIWTHNAQSLAQFMYWGIEYSLIGTNPTSTVEENKVAFRAWLSAQATAGTPVIVQYQLETPTRTNITDTVLGQALLSMRTVPHYTRIYTKADIQPWLSADVKVINRGE